MRSLILLLSTAALAACNMSADAEERPGSGQTTQRSFDVGAFENVALAGSQDVIVTVGGPASVRAQGDPDIIDRLDIRVEGGTLKIGTKKNSNWTVGFMRNRKPVTIYVTTPRLASAVVAGSGDMKVDKVEGDRFEGAVAGSGDLQIAAIRVNQAEFSVAGSGDVMAAGTAERLTAKLAGSGDIELAGLAARHAELSVAGSGDLRARASDTASVSLVGSGDVSVAGAAKCTISKRGSGDVRCEG